MDKIIRCILYMGFFMFDNCLLCKMFFMIFLILFLFNIGSLFVSLLNLFIMYIVLFYLSSLLMYY